MTASGRGEAASAPIRDLKDIDSQRVATWLGVEAHAIEVTAHEVLSAGHAGRSSRLARVVVNRSSLGAPASQALFVKWGKPDSSLRTLRACLQEVRFLSRSEFAPSHPNDPFVHCYDACGSEELGRWHLVLDDIEATHRCPKWGASLSAPDADQAVRALGRLHARFWKHPILQTWFPPSGEGDGRSGHFQRRLATHLCAPVSELMEVPGAFEARLPRALVPRIARLVGLLPRLMDERASGALTLLHGDPHPQNFMLPRHSPRAAKLIDWQGCWPGMPTLDVAYLALTGWTKEERRRYEDAWLVGYHEELVAGKVTDYSLAECRRDYELAISCLVVVPYNFRLAGAPQELWGTLLDRWLAAYDDHGSAAAGDH